MIPYALAAACAVGCPEPHSDSDGDQVTDCVERRTGTDPRSSDSDADGVADGREDKNRDGHVDPGETDPRVPGLFPGAAPHIPEPLAFDLVRGLGARAGELEINTLAISPWSRRGPVEWAPEIEWAPRDDLALELELSIHNTQLHALKLALQFTFPHAHRRDFIAGWQLIGTYAPGERLLETTSLFIAGYRFDRRWSALAMAGLRADWSRQPFALGAAGRGETLRRERHGAG